MEIATVKAEAVVQGYNTHAHMHRRWQHGIKLLMYREQIDGSTVC